MTDWLGSWEPEQYFGKHERVLPADNGTGYRYNPNVHGNDLWLRDWSRVSRAIPVEGTLEKASWNQSPQVKFWLDKPKQSLLRRFVECLHE